MCEAVELPVLAVDMGGTSVKYAWISHRGELTERQIADVPESLSRITELLCRLAGERKTCGIAVSMPGIIDTARGIALSGGVYEFIRNVPLLQMLEECTALPCWIGNDAKCAGLAESKSGSLKGVQDGAVLVLGTGIGGCLILGGKVRDGAFFRSGQFSNLYLKGGQWWDFGSLHGLQEMIRKHLGTNRKYTGKEIFRMADCGEAAVLAALREYTGYLAKGIYNIQALLDLEKYVVGGGISTQPLLCNLLQEEVQKLFSQNTDDTMHMPQIAACRYYNDANLLGAWYGWKERNKV